MSNPVLAISEAVADHVGPVFAPIIGVIGMGAGMILVILTFIAAANWMERRNA